MKNFLYLLALYVLVIGCAPGNSTISKQLLFEPPVISPESAPEETATKRSLREVVTPNPDGQILDNTNWVLEYAIIDGERRELKAHETLKLYFKPDRVSIYDGCNYGSYGGENGRSSYIAAENGDFVLPWVLPQEDGTYETTFVSRSADCHLIDDESGERHRIGIPEFVPPYEEIVAYELNPDQLLLYYPEDRRNVLVFGAGISLPESTRMPTQMPEPTVASLATTLAIPTQNPAPIIVSPMAYPAPTLLPTPPAYP